jgi:hypothetical protein
VNRPEARGGSGWPELEKKASLRPSGVLGGAMGVRGDVLKREKGLGSIYSRNREVPENGISPASNYGEAVAWQAISRRRQLRIRPPVPFEALSWSNLAGSSRMRRNGLTGAHRRQSSCLLISDHDDGSAAFTEERTATRWPLVAWAVRRTAFCDAGFCRPPLELLPPR